MEIYTRDSNADRFHSIFQTVDVIDRGNGRCYIDHGMS